MDVESERAPLADLFRILTGGELSEEDHEELVDEALAAFADPKAYAAAVVEEDPNERWLTEYFITNEDPVENGRRLLSWIIYHQLGPWVCRSDKLDELLEQVDDRVAEAGVEMEALTYDYENEPEDPRDHYCRLANDRLAKASDQAKTLVHLDTGMSDEMDLYVIDTADRPRLFELGRHYALKVSDSWG